MTGRLVDVGRTLHSRIKEFFDAPPDPRATPLEITNAVLDAIEAKVQPIGRGQRAFPYSLVTVRLAPVEADRPSLHAAFARVLPRLRERFKELRCVAPESLDVRLVCLKKTPADWPEGRLFTIDCTAGELPASASAEAPSVAAALPPSEVTRATVAAKAGAPRPLRITILKGASTEQKYRFTQPTIRIGRTAEPTDGNGRVRRNDVVFADVVDGVTETVGRAHARLQYQPAAGEYRLFNEASSNPTFLVRAGATIQVAPRDPRGVRLRNGDEIHLGRAAIRVSLDEPAS